MVNSFMTGEMDAIGLIGAAFLRLSERMKDALCMFQPITWMVEGPVLCAQENCKSILDLQGSAISSPPLASDLMAYWKALIFHNYGYNIEDLFDLRPSPRPEQLLKGGSVRGSFVSGYAWAAIRESAYSVVTSMRTEWDHAVGHERMPVMGALVSRRGWFEENRMLAETISARLAEGLRLYQKDRTVFIKSITEWDGILSEISLSTKEAAYWCSYWGMNALSEDRLKISVDDRSEFVILRNMMLKAGCFDEYAN